MNLESGLMMKNKKGFTLIELLAVIVILGILLSISVTAVNKIRKKQNNENILNVINSILTGAKSYIAEHPKFWNSTETKEYATGSTKPKQSEFGTVKWINLKEVIENSNFDTEKFPELYYKNGKKKDGTKSIFVKYCENKYKYEIVYEYKIVYEYNTFYLSDCGCEEQFISNHAFKFCEANNKGAGWDINGKYYDSTGNNVSGKDINFEK